LLESEQVEPHAALEFEALLPPYRVVGYEAAPSDLCSAATALLGEVPIDVFRYRDHLRDLACRSGWEWIAEDLPPDAVTGSAVVWREGLVFLERRPVTAAVSPGVLDTFGGHVEAGDPVAEAMARELREELGISPLSPRFLTAYERQEDPPGKLYHHGIWLVRSWRGASDPTHPHGVWVRPEAALADPSLNPALVPVLRSLVPVPARGRVQGS
jgi:8-oxo-dGTP pyrophosphatase MutT (NUDIX family)